MPASQLAVRPAGASGELVKRASGSLAAARSGANRSFAKNQIAAEGGSAPLYAPLGLAAELGRLQVVGAFASRRAPLTRPARPNLERLAPEAKAGKLGLHCKARQPAWLPGRLKLLGVQCRYNEPVATN